MRQRDGYYCAAGECRALLRAGSATRAPIRFGGQTYCRACALERRRWLEQRRERIAREDKDCA